MIKRVLNLLLIALVLVASNACSSKGEITVASYNVRYDNRGDAERGNAWENRH